MISLRGLNLEFRNFKLRDINLEVESGDYLMLVGPTGAGKTLLLETIAGLYKMKSGEIWIDDKEITLLEPEMRNISMVYQDSALFPHLSVADNILFGLKVRRKTTNSMKKELVEIASLVGVDHLLDRKPRKLSGGERQKVALARALAVKPSLLLLDEPLSALDPENRERLQLELKRIHKELNITIIHVSHDFDEAMILGKHVAVIGEGSVKQAGTPETIFHRPNSEFVARFTMMRNILPGAIIQKSESRNTFRSGGMDMITTSLKEVVTHACIRPDDIRLSTNLSVQNGLNKFAGRIVGIEDRGMTFHVIVDVPPQVCSLVSRHQVMETNLMIGQQVIITFDPDSVHLF